MNYFGVEPLELVVRGDFCGARSQDLDGLFEPAGAWSKLVQPSLEVTKFVGSSCEPSL